MVNINVILVTEHLETQRICFFCRHVLVVTTVQLYLTNPELRFYPGLNPARCVSEVCDGENL